MQLSFHGADREVTGSCHLVEAAGRRVLIDCGMYQGGREARRRERRGSRLRSGASVDFLLLTHAHLDHCGRLPLLVKRGFHGEIITTAASRELARVVLLDSAHLHEEEARHETHRAARARPRRTGGASVPGPRRPQHLRPLRPHRAVQRGPDSRPRPEGHLPRCRAHPRLGQHPPPVGGSRASGARWPSPGTSATPTGRCSGPRSPPPAPRRSSWRPPTGTGCTSRWRRRSRNCSRRSAGRSSAAAMW